MSVKNELRGVLAKELSNWISATKHKQIIAAEMLGIPQPRISRLINGNFEHLSSEAMMSGLLRVGYTLHTESVEGVLTIQIRGPVNAA